MELIYSYTRAEALADGVLVDVSELAAEAGFRIPVALTCGAWQQSVAVPQSCIQQDETGRLWDVLNVLRYAARRNGETDQIQFPVVVQNSRDQLETITLIAVIRPGDDGLPVLTVMLPGED